MASESGGFEKMKSSFYLQKKNELLELIENTLQRLLKSEDLAKINSQWLLDEIYRIKKEVETDSFSSEKNQDLWSKIARIGDEYRKLQRNA